MRKSKMQEKENKTTILEVAYFFDTSVTQRMVQAIMTNRHVSSTCSLGAQATIVRS
jgi:hypothetical protein